MLRTVLVIFTFVLLCGFCTAGWQESDGSKMHYPQLPDISGWSIGAGKFNPIADDWQCTQTGPVSNIYLWMSWAGDADPSEDLPTLELSIYSNDSSGDFDKPGDYLWGRGLEDQLSYTVALWDTGDMGLFNTFTNEYQESDHSNIYLISIENISDPYTQQAGETYWLSFYTWSAYSEDGWDSSAGSFGSGAVWTDPDMALWQPLNDPVTGQPLDMAFVITPEPMTISLLAIGAAIISRRRRS